MLTVVLIIQYSFIYEDINNNNKKKTNNKKTLLQSNAHRLWPLGGPLKS